MSETEQAIEQVIKNYLAAWNETDPQARLSSINVLLSSNCIYADSHMPDLVETRKLHSEFIDRFKSKFPELKIGLVDRPDIHHGFFRFRWQLTQPNGDVFTKGVFFGETDRENQITKLVGFVD